MTLTHQQPPLGSSPDSTPSPRPEPDVALEGLRGVAALLVALEHMWGMGLLFDKDSSPIYLRMWGAGHAAVLVFFVLSGYVIGLTNQADFTWPRARAYLGRRALRLLPIFWIALLLTRCINHGDSSLTYFISALMLQNEDFTFAWPFHPPRSNGPMWSLHYEVIYYLLFLLPWWRPRWMRPSVWVALTIGALGWILPAGQIPNAISGYAVGWIFWSAGWWLSHLPRLAPSDRNFPLVAGLLLLIATHLLNSGTIFLFGLGLKATSHGFVNLSNLAFLPCCLMLVGGVAGRDFPLRRTATLLAFIIPVSTSLLLLFTGRLTNNLTEIPTWGAGAALSFGALALAGLRSRDWLLRFAPLGRISYAFYLVHMPLLFIVNRWGFYATNLPASILATVLWLTLSLSLAAVLELGLQPRLRHFFAPRPATP